MEGLEYVVQWPDVGINSQYRGKKVTYSSMTGASMAVCAHWGMTAVHSGNTFWNVPDGYRGSPGETYSRVFKDLLFILTIE